VKTVLLFVFLVLLFVCFCLSLFFVVVRVVLVKVVSLVLKRKQDRNQLRRAGAQTHRITCAKKILSLA